MADSRFLWVKIYKFAIYHMIWRTYGYVSIFRNKPMISPSRNKIMEGYIKRTLELIELREK